MLRYIYIVLGLLSLAMGLLGIVTPGIPTTPFLLLTAFLFTKSSPRLHQWLLENKITGRYIKQVNTGFSLKALLISITFMWCMICFTTFIIFENWTYRYIMLGLGVVGTISQLIVLRKRKKECPVIEIEDNNNDKNKVS